MDVEHFRDLQILHYLLWEEACEPGGLLKMDGSLPSHLTGKGMAFPRLP